jgi:hypothetical protein
MQIGPPAGQAYGATALPAELAWNPAKYGATAAAAAQTQPNMAGAIPATAAGHAAAVLPFVVVVGVLWLLAERHAAIKGRVSGGIGGALT